MEIKNLKNKVVHFIGIGGISMSALAQILFANGIKVQGSDLAENAETQILQKKGIKVYKGHFKSNVESADVVVYSSAIHEDNEEFSYAKQNNLLILKRAELLGMIANCYKFVVAIAGSHGKTTTTAMISEIFLKANLKPTFHIGGVLNSIHSNFKIGNKNFFITEACEYMDNFLYIKPNVSVVLNVDGDHLDYFKNIEGVKNSFKKFKNNKRYQGVSIACIDDENSKEFIEDEDVVTFGLDKKADLRATNIKQYKPCYYSFDVMFMRYKLGNIKLNIIGKHNILNALASILVGISCAIDFNDMKEAIENFSGVERRCEKICDLLGAEIYHDYAHHPKQIEKMVKVAKDLTFKTNGKVVCVFEPHTYSRTKFLLDDFAKSFYGSDHVIFSPAYSAREDMSEGFEADILAKKTSEFVKEVEYLLTYDEIYNRISDIVKKGDVVMILGAGTIEKLAEKFKYKNNI